MSELNLLKADKLEVTVLVDNYTDVLLVQSTEVARRPGTPPPNLPLAEHGLSCLLKISEGSEEHTVLMDAGVSKTCLFHNADVLKTDLSKVESVVISHGHFDHFGALIEFLKSASKVKTLVLHPDAFLKRRLNIPGIGVVDLPALDEADLKKTGVMPHKVNEASTLASYLIMVSGEVPRITDFEMGFPWAEAKRTRKVHAVLGGFHLTGPIFEPIIEPTIAEMKKIAPDFVVPMHCTGWKAINQFAREMPEQFLLNTVGTTYIFQ